MPLNLPEARSLLTLKLKPWQTGDVAFQPNEIQLVVTEAVETYSRYKPIQTIEDLALIADQAAYDFPEGTLWVESCFFTDEEFSGFAYPIDPESPADLYRRLINQRLVAGFWLKKVEVDELQQKIIFSPTPTETTTGKVIVNRAHAYDAENNHWPTIPDIDKPYILKYAEGSLLSLLARAYSLNSNDVGDRVNRGLNLASYLQEQADKLQSEFLGRFRMPTVARS